MPPIRTVLHINLGTSSKLDRSRRRHLVDIGVTDRWTRLVDLLERLHSPGQAGVGSVRDLRCKANGADGTSSLRPLSGHVLVEGARVVPRKAYEDGATVLLEKNVGDELLRLIEVFGGGCHGQQDTKARPQTIMTGTVDGCFYDRILREGIFGPIKMTSVACGIAAAGRESEVRTQNPQW